MQKYFLDPTRQELFGVPFPVRVVPDLTTGDELYGAVWSQVRHCFDALDVVPRSGRWGFVLRRITRHGEALAAASPLLVRSGGVVAAGALPLDVDADEAIAVDVPNQWLKAFDRRLAAFTDVHPSVEAVAAARAEPVSLVDCMRSMVTPEVVTAHSPTLSRLRGEYAESEQTKAASLWRPPPVLTIVLKRFRETPGGSRHKLSTPVAFPLDGLDLAEFMPPGALGAAAPVYDCVAVVNHVGGLHGGHYTCAARLGWRAGGMNLNPWQLFDDSRVSVLEAAQVCSPTAYILFFELRAAAPTPLAEIFPPRPSAISGARVDPATVRTAAFTALRTTTGTRQYRQVRRQQKPPDPSHWSSHCACLPRCAFDLQVQMHGHVMSPFSILQEGVGEGQWFDFIPEWARPFLGGVAVAAAAVVVKYSVRQAAAAGQVSMGRLQ